MWRIERHATGDFETYSEAGYEWDEPGQKWTGPAGGKDKGIAAVGTLVYAEHPSTEVLTFSYRLPGDPAVTRWRPGMPNPQRLFDYLAAGGLIEFHNAMFERSIWFFVCRRLYGWPELPVKQIRCSMAKARVNCLPGALAALTGVLPVHVVKNPDGKRLLDKFSIPRKPTKADARKRIRPEDDPEDGERLYAYCDTDVLAEEEVSELMMPMSAAELEFWQLDQEINWRGIAIDMASVHNMIAILDQALVVYGEEHRRVTNGLNPTQTEAVRGWLAARGVDIPNMQAETIETALEGSIPSDARRVLEIRQLTGSASVKKLYAMARMTCADGRIRNILIHHGARTGRPTGDLLQPLNLAKAGPDLIYCEECKSPSKFPPFLCPWCGVRMSLLSKSHKWPDVPKGVTANPVDKVQEIMATRSLPQVEFVLGDALLCISGSIRGMLQAGEGCELIASDYSAIEAVVTAALAGEEWRMEVFRKKEDIYLHSAASITGRNSIQGYLDYKEEHGSHHPDRQKIGKIAELALGFGGWVGGWRGFDDSDTFTDPEVKQKILAWRAASPRIVEMWGGQSRGEFRDKYQEYFGFEGCFIQAIQHPERFFEYAGIRFYMRGDALIVRLLSGRELTYQSPRLYPSRREWAPSWELAIQYMTWNSNPKYDVVGWGPMATYSGKITENIVQATAHDIQRFGILALERAGYPIVLHVYDEDVAEVPIGFGSLEEFETIMSTMPPWAADWPIRASGGWRGKRYRKA